MTVTNPLESDVTATRTEDGGIEVTTSVRNTSDETVKFTTASGKLFTLTLFAVSEPVCWSPSVGYTQALKRWSIAPGESITQSFEWKTQEDWKSFLSEHDLEFTQEDATRMPDPTIADHYVARLRFCASDEDLRLKSYHDLRI